MLTLNFQVLYLCGLYLLNGYILELVLVLLYRIVWLILLGFYLLLIKYIIFNILL